MSKKRDAINLGFLEGVVWALGILADDYGMLTIAEDIWKESGYRKSETCIACEYDVRKLRKAVPGLRKGVE